MQYFPCILNLLRDLEGDRVQWFRAEAEMQRWQEQWEQKIAELLQTGRSFAKMQLVWAELAANQPQDRPGAKAYALQKSAMYDRRRRDAYKNLTDIGHGALLGETANLIEFVEEQRKKEVEFIERAVEGQLVDNSSGISSPNRTTS